MYNKHMLDMCYCKFWFKENFWESVQTKFINSEVQSEDTIFKY